MKSTIPYWPWPWWKLLRDVCFFFNMLELFNSGTKNLALKKNIFFNFMVLTRLPGVVTQRCSQCSWDRFMFGMRSYCG